MIAALKTVAAVVAAAGLLYAMQRTTPGYSDITSPIVASGRQGETVRASAFSFGVNTSIVSATPYLRP